MKHSHVDDPLVTRYVDGEAAADEERTVHEHLESCSACRTRVDAEAAARRLLRARAAAARAVGTPVPWRPRVSKLGEPSRMAAPRTLAALAASSLVAVALVIWFAVRPATMAAVGIIGDSYCGERHRYASGPGDEGDCTLRCVARGASFVLITDEQVYRILDADPSRLAALANTRVTVRGVFGDESVSVAEISAN